MRRPFRRVALVSFVAAIAASGCDRGLTDVNRNPNNPEVVPVGTLLQSGIWQLVANRPGRGVFGEWTTLYHVSTWAQHTAQSAFNDQDRYTPFEGIPEDIWEEMYGGALADLDRVRELAEEAGDESLAAVAEILLSYGFLFLTDLYGDIPYTQALAIESFTEPEFDLQSEIYPDLLRRLQVAAERIDPGASTPWAGGDLVHGGDLDRWKAFAHSLRLRVAMRISGTPEAATARAAFADAWAAGRIDSNEDAADVDWTGTAPAQNPIYESLVLGGRGGVFRVSRTLVDALSTTDDPRLSRFATPAASDGRFRGLPNGLLPSQVDGGSTANDFSTVGPALLSASAPSVLMSHAEVLFLGAEAAERGWIAADPEALYRDGIAASMRQYEVSESEIEAYLSGPSAAYEGIESIHVQKWIALYLQGPEAYAEVRRTGVPALPLPAQAVIDGLPARMPYPANEGLFNRNFAPYANVEYTEPLWWM